jgi:tryptophan synthase alpha subunit
VITAVAEQYKTKGVTFEKMFEMSRILDEEKHAEFVALLWRLCIKYNREQFIKDFKTKELKSPLRAKYHEYLR